MQDIACSYVLVKLLPPKLRLTDYALIQLKWEDIQSGEPYRYKAKPIKNKYKRRNTWNNTEANLK